MVELVEEEAKVDKAEERIQKKTNVQKRITFMIKMHFKQIGKCYIKIH